MTDPTIIIPLMCAVLCLVCTAICVNQAGKAYGCEQMAGIYCDAAKRHEESAYEHRMSTYDYCKNAFAPADDTETAAEEAKVSRGS